MNQRDVAKCFRDAYGIKQPSRHAIEFAGYVRSFVQQETVDKVLAIIEECEDNSGCDREDRMANAVKRIKELSPKKDQVFIRKGGAFYRSGWCGYTNNVQEAGRYDRKDAINHCATVEGAVIAELATYLASEHPHIESQGRSFQVDFALRQKMEFMDLVNIFRAMNLTPQTIDKIERIAMQKAGAR